MIDATFSRKSKSLNVKALYLLVMLCIGNFMTAQVITPFTKIYQVTQKGGIVFLANSSLGCSVNPPVSGAATCTAGVNETPPGGTYQDNSFNSTYIDIDGDATTVSSSSDSLNLPTCSGITKAYLFWGANGNTTPNYNICKLKINNGSYQTITATASQTNTTGYNTYHCYADVTSLMQAGGIKSRVTVADVKSNSLGSSNTFGSWTMVIVYNNDLLTMRQLTIFNGLANISSGNPTVNIPISGFLTPASGPVTFEVGVYVHDGDRSQTGDNLRFNGGSGFVGITDALNPNNDVMNSTVSNNGVLTPYRIPNMKNTAGLDADIFVPNNSAKNYITNSVTSATFQMTTSSETYLPQMITTAIDVYEPDLRASVKVRDVNGGSAVPGDILEYRVKGINIGSDPSVNSYITDTIEQNGIYVPNSIKIVYGPNLGAKTDATGDDQVEYVSAGHFIKVRIGTGANAVSGGTVTNSTTGTDSTVFTYSVTVTNSCTKIACDNVIDARAYILGQGAVSTNTFSNGSNPGIFDAFGCPVPGTTSTPITATACATPTAAASSASVCSGSTFTLSSSSDPEATYSWTGPNSFTAAVQSPVAGPATPAMSGTYTVTLTGYAGCSRSATTSVTINSSPTLTASSTATTLCSGTQATLTASGATSYTWNPGPLAGATVTVAPSSSTVYTVSGANAIGCVGTQTLGLTVNPVPTLTASASSGSICAGGTGTLSASGANTYTWNPGALTGSVVTVSPSSPTVYTVTGSSALGCTSTKTVSLGVNPVPTLTLSASASTVCANATVTLNASGASTYTWNPGGLTGASVTGTITSSTVYTVTATNAAGCTNTGTIGIALNNCPAAVNDATTTAQGSPVVSNAGTNDVNTAGGTFSTGPVTAGSGTITMNPSTGQYTYTPAAGFTGTASATYTLCNGSPVVCSSAVITVTVFPTIVANPDVASTTPGTATTGSLTGNDGGIVTGETYSVSVTQPAGTTGTITVNPATGQYTFTPNPSYTGTTTTTYTLCNTSVNPSSCSSTTITIVVSPTVVAVADGTTTVINTAVSGNASTNDTKGVNPVYTGGAVTAGTGTLTMNASGQYTYTPAAGFTGTTTATYTLCNISSPPCSTTTITFTVFPNIVANPDVVSTTPAVPTTGSLTTNDGGIVAGETFSVSVTQPSPTTGTITVNPATGQYTFTPNPVYTGSTTTTYTICNTSVSPSSCSSTTITIIVGTTPVAVADGSTTVINTTVSGNLGTNDSGAGAGLLPSFTAGPVTPGTGTLTVNGSTGSYTYTPATGFTGTTTATYTLCNISSPPCSTTTITFTVFPNIVANPDVVSTTPGTATTGSLTGNDGGIVAGETYSVSVTQPAGTTGTITVNPSTGQYTFTPNASYTGSTTTTYTICNTSVNPSSCSSTTITIVVSPTVIAVADGTTTVINTAVSGNAGTNDTKGVNPVYTGGAVTAGTGTLTMNASGQYTYTPATGFTGTTTATYTLCNISSPPCSTTTITFTVFPNIVANPDVVTTQPAVTATGSLTANDGGIVAGETFSVSVTQPSPSTGTITVNPSTGQYTFTPNPSYTGSTTTTYTICNTSVNPSSCSSTTITLIVGTLPVAVADGTTTMQGTAVSGNLGTNDTGAGSGLNPVFTAGPVTAGTGTLTVNPSTGSYTYTPAPGFTGTTTATYTLCNVSSPPCSTTTITFTVFPTLTANPDGVSTTPGVASSGTLTTNDNGVVPGATYSVSVTQPAGTTGTITVNPATGQYTFTPNPSYTGSTTTTYTICNTSVNPSSCSSTTINIVVSPTVVAVADGTTTVINTAVSGSAGGNDVGGVNPVYTGGAVTAGTGTLTMNASGQYTYTPATGFTGTTTATYTLCNISSPPCSTTTITFTVFPAIVANPDVVNTTPGTATTGSLTGNDGGIVPGETYSVSVTQPSPSTGTITVNPSTGQYTFTPNPSYTGSTTTTYTICNTSVNPSSCSSTTINIVVSPTVIAVADGTTTVINTTVTGNASGNDTPGVNPVFTAGPVTPGTGTITMNPSTGQYTFTPATGFTGTTTATYTLCNISSPPCATTTITFTVFPAIVANPDVVMTTPGASTTGSLTGNDGGIVPGETFSVSVTQPAPGSGTITIDPATGSYTFTPDPAFSGSVSTTYTICNTSVNPSACSSSTITIIVGAPPVAVADGNTTTESTPVSGSLASNDTGAGSTLSPVFTADPLNPGTGTLTLDPSTGSYTYTPATGFTGTTTTTYTLCNITSPPCSTATITFTVFPAIVANPDVINTTPGASTTGSLTGNDGGIVPGETYSVGVTQPAPGTGTITVDPATGSYTFTPDPTYTGTTSTTYTLCNVSVNPPDCSSSTITIVVSPTVMAVADGTTTVINTAVTGDASGNDTPGVNPVFTAGPMPAGTGTLTMDPATGQYTYTPATGFVGTATATYTLCNISSPPCSTTTITFTVFPNIVANPDIIATTPNTPTSGTLTGNDNGIVTGETYSVSVTQPSPSTGTITVDPSTGSYTFTPNPAYTGSTTTTYTVCNTDVNPPDCSVATITITVGNAPVAIADGTITVDGTPVSGNAGDNDSGDNSSLSPVFIGGPVTAGTGTFTIDPATGSYTYTPATGFTGTTTATYTLCNISSPPCSTTTITFTVFPHIVANPDVIATTPGTVTTGTLTTNDGGLVPGETYSVGVTQPSPSTGTITVDPATGSYTFTPDPAYTGSTTTTYTICNLDVNPPDCSVATITITVGNAPVAIADGTATAESTPVSGNLGDNDSGAGASLSPVFTAGPVTPGTGTFTVDPATGSYTYTPATGFTGTATATYTLCNLSSPPCSTTTITFTVFPNIVANPDVIATTSTLTTTGNLTGNDNGLVPGETYSVSVTQPAPGSGTITVDPATGSYTFTPDPSFTGSVTTTYTICNTSVNPSSCSSSSITIIVGQQQVAAAKSLVSTQKLNASTYQAVYAFNMTSMGSQPATNVQLTDNLNNTFPAPMTYTVTGLSAGSPLTANAGFDGNTNIALLSGSDILPVGQIAVVTLTVNFSPNTTTLTSISNSGVATSAGAPDPTGSGMHLSADSTNAGTDADPNGNGNPNDPGENTPTVIGQQVGAAKTSAGFVKINATTFQTVFTFNVANIGPVAATNVQLTDNLNNAFPAPVTYTVVGLTAASPLTANSSYDGNTNIALLSGSNTLGVNQSAMVTLTVNFSPNTTTLTALKNVGVASTSDSADPNGNGVHTSIDTTAAGTNPDPNGNGNPNEPGENNPTFFGEQIAAAKTASMFTKVNATTFQTVFTFNLANVGPVAASNVQLTDNLSNTFPAPMTYTVVGLTAGSPLTANGSYNGSSNIALLSGSNTLNASQSAVVTLTVNFNPNTTTITAISNIGIATTSGSADPNGNGVHTSTDTTAAGTNPDPDGDGNPNGPGENNPTFFGQQIAGTKTASALTKVNATTFQTVFTFNVSNIGPVAATNVQLTDNLNNTFAAPVTYTVVGITAAAPLTANGSYNGSSNIALLSGSNTLNASQSALVTLTVNFSMNGSTATSLSNTGVVSTSSSADPNGNGVHTSVDTTYSGSNPDPNGNGNPNDPGENSPTVFGQQIGAAKEAVSSTALDNGMSQSTFVFTVQNLGAVPATNVQLTDNLSNAFPAPITYSVSSLTSGPALTANTGFNGSSDMNLLSGTNTLAVGAAETITLVVQYNMNGSNPGMLYNSGVATTHNAGGSVLSSDTTDAGNNPDANGNGNPNEPGENDPTGFVPPATADTATVLHIPQGFSPNGDGVNDLFVIRGISAYPNNNFSVLNRWGNEVYKMKGYDNTWNGKSGEGLRFGGDDLPEGTYFYILDLGDGSKPYKGYIYLNKTVK